MSPPPARLTTAPDRGPTRAAAAVAVVVVTLGVAIAAAAATTDPASGLNIAVDRLSARSSGLLGDLGTLLPLGFAFAAGMVAAVNPCGFPLLPAYIAIFVGDHDAGGTVTPRRRLLRAVRASAGVTLGFVVLFATVGMLLSLGARVLLDWLPWLAAALGVLLVLVGGYRFAGSSPDSSLPAQLAARVRLPGSGGAFYLGFGLAYGLASLSCTLPIFLAVAGTSLTATTTWSSLGSLTLYGLGMGSVILALSLGAATVQTALAVRLRRLLPFMSGIGTVSLFVAGGYIVYYWLTVGGLLDRLG